MNLSNVIKAEDILIDLPVTSKAGLIKAMSSHAAVRTGIDQAVIQKALLKREELGSTGIGSGVAIPHTALEGLETPFTALAILEKAIDFESVDEVPIDVAFLLLSPPDQSPDYLKILSAVARRAHSDQVLKLLRSAGSPAKAYAILVDDMD